MGAISIAERIGRIEREERIKLRAFELAAEGIDDGVVGMSTDPFTSGFPQAVGLRVPEVTHGGVSPLLRERYLFCLATRRISRPGTRLIGARQGATIGCDLDVGTPPFRPIELQITSPFWHFADGNISWHIVVEQNGRPTNQNSRPQTDTVSWAKDFSDGPAMLYDTFTNSVVDPNTGAPLLYMDGLTAYSPPKLHNTWRPIAGGNLNCFYDMKFDWTSDVGWEAFGDRGVELAVGSRISFYASVLQTDPTSTIRSKVISSAQVLDSWPEESFLQLFKQTGEEAGSQPVYWRVFGALVFLDEV
jgi:hypothetical protein